MAADIYTKAFHDSVRWNSLGEHINLVEPGALKLPHIHDLHSLLLTGSVPVTGKKIHDEQKMP